ncbi:MAG: YcxB family protein, partial [Myxococcota bacterium]
VGLLLLLGGAFLALSAPIEHQRMARRAKKGPFFGRVLQVHLTDEGYSMKADISDTLATWDSVTRAVRFEDGHLLYVGPDAAIWLPQGALTEGSPTEVRALLMEKIPNYEGIPDRSEA